MNINEIKIGQGNINLEAEIIEKGPIRTFSKFGRTGKVCNATIKDETGTTQLTLWNEDAEKYQEGDKIRLKDCYANEWQGEIQVTTGRNGSIEKI